MLPSCAPVFLKKFVLHLFVYPALSFLLFFIYVSWRLVMVLGSLLHTHCFRSFNYFFKKGFNRVKCNLKYSKMHKSEVYSLICVCLCVCRQPHQTIEDFLLLSEGCLLRKYSHVQCFGQQQITYKTVVSLDCNGVEKLLLPSDFSSNCLQYSVQ